MPANFITLLFYILAAAVGLAAMVTIIALGATIFALAFVYIFIPLFIIAGLRWLWFKYKYSQKGRITFRDND